MNFQKLTDGQKVMVYIPALDQFFRMEVCKLIVHPKGGFSISNYGRRSSERIQGHEFLGRIHCQEDLDKFFYIEPGKVIEESFIKAKEHFAKNGLSWIFECDSCLIHQIDDEKVKDVREIDVKAETVEP